MGLSYMMPPIFLKTNKDLVLAVGDGCPCRVNCNVGINSEARRKYETNRLEAILKSEYQPDTFMDLSVGRYERPFYRDIQERFNIPIGFVPSYLLPEDRAINKREAVSILKKLADDGLSFLTLHLTASEGLWEVAKKTRRIPVTSRGGGAVVRQILMSNGHNIWMKCLSEIIEIAKKYGIVISLGATFRPAGISDACDDVHLMETEKQLELCRLLRAEGVRVLVENVGHISIDRLEKHCNLLRQFGAPIMPLGPSPTDDAVGVDHTAAAIGATFMGYWGCAHIINCITRSEHKNSFFTIEETLEAIRTARLAAHIVDVTRGISLEKDSALYEERAESCSCISGQGNNCTRCAIYCPLKLKY